VALLWGCRNEPVARLSVQPESVLLLHARCTPLQFRWTLLRPLGPSRGTPNVFVHLLDGSHNLVRTFDHQPPFPWSPGAEFSYEHPLCLSAMAEPLREGTYALRVGLYDDASEDRWPLQTSGVESGKRGYRIAEVEVPGRNDQGPVFAFGPTWPEAEPTSEKQNLMRRRIPVSGVLEVSQVTRPAVLRLAVHYPDGSWGVMTVSSSCGEASRQVRGSGVVELPIVPSSSGSCQVRFALGSPMMNVHLVSIAVVE
jgi:hypothetical protein